MSISSIGIIGGGQLGSMLATAAKKLNIKNNITNFKNFYVVIFLVNHKGFNKIYKNFKKKNKLIIDLFSFYSQ